MAIATDLGKVDEVLEKYDYRSSALVGMLQDLQDEYGYLPKEALQKLAERLEVPLSRVYGMATFYKIFRLQPRGKHDVCVCLGTACHVRGGAKILEKLERTLGIRAGQTTSDLRFTLETVNCLGACAVGPLMTVDGEYHGKMTLAKVDGVLKEYGDSGSPVVAVGTVAGGRER